MGETRRDPAHSGDQGETPERTGEESRQKAEESGRLFQSLFDMASIGMAQADPHTGRWLYVNRKMCEITGYSREEMLALRISEITHPEDRLRDSELFQSAVRGEIPSFQLEKRYQRKDGSVAWVNVNVALLRDSSGNPLRTIATIEEITDRKAFEAEILRMNRLYLALSRIHRFILQVKTQEELLEGVCRILVTHGELKMAWIGRQDAVSMQILPVARYQDPGGYTDQIRVYADERPEGRGPTGTAVRERRPMVCNHFAEAPETAPWRQIGIREGFAASAAFPIPVEGEVREVLTVYAGEPGFFRDKEILLFEEAAASIGSAIGSLKREELRHGAEEAVRQSEERHRAVLQTAMDGFLIIDSCGFLREVNETYCRMSGYGADELLIMNINDLEYAESKEATAIHIQWVIARGEDRFESCHRRKDGSAYNVEVSVQYRPLEGGQFVAFIRDITERKRVTEEIREGASRARAMLQAIPDMMFRINRQGIFLDYQARPEDLHVLPGTSLIGLRNRDITPPDFADLIDRKTALALATGELQSFEYQLPIPGKGLRSYEARMVASGPEEVTTIVRDITDRKRAEEERQKLQAQLIQAQKLESIGRLAGGVAHDFNNMLSVILGYVDIALMNPDLPPSLLSELSEIREAAGRSASLTRQLLAFARRQPISPEVLDLNEVIEGLLKMLRRLIGENIRLTWNPAIDLWAVKMDPSQIDQMMTNLCVNARDAITGIGKINIETENISLRLQDCASDTEILPGDYVLLRIRDDGSGMSRETLENLFEPFFTTKELGRGTGLGLATVYGIVQQNKGFIRVQSEPAQGTVFRIYLPRHRKTAGGTPKPVAAGIVRGSETILLVEDEAPIMRMTANVLKRLGYTVLGASLPSEALRLAEGHPGTIRLLLTDVVMPEMNGQDLRKILEDRIPGLRCLFISGYSADVIASQGILPEGVHFIQKPFSVKDLALKIREALASE